MAVFEKNHHQSSESPGVVSKNGVRSMITMERVNALIDLELAKKAFLFLSVASLLVIPLDGFWIYWGRTKPAPAPLASQEKPAKKLEPQEVYLTNFDRSALFGDAPAGIGTPVLQASLAELTKDYRLQGVLLMDDPEAIIQDARTQKTIFVKKGGQLGELTVKEIKEGLIILTYLGEEIKLEIQ